MGIRFKLKRKGTVVSRYTSGLDLWYLAYSLSYLTLSISTVTCIHLYEYPYINPVIKTCIEL